MSDYIERQAVIDAIHCDITITGRQNAELVASTIGAFVDRVKALPSADVVPVIRCADCALYIASRHWCGFNVAKMYEHDFCSYGKKREG